MNDIIETFIHDHLFLHLVLIAVSMTAIIIMSFTARTVDERWMTMIIVPQGYDKDGKLCTVLVAIRDATEEIGRAHV